MRRTDWPEKDSSGRWSRTEWKPRTVISFKLTLLASTLLITLARGETGDVSFLRTRKNEIVDGTGKPVMLRGVNLGSWLVFEPWMSPMDSSGLKDHHSAEQTLQSRFGKKAAAELVEIYQDNWITARDLDAIASYGMNVIRVPFWYRNLQTEEGAPLPEGFARLDRVISGARERGIYTILDLHGAPGGQTAHASTGRLRERADLWEDERQITRTVALWKTLAQRYRGNPAVAAYDLLNEPTEAPSPGRLWATYDRIYRAIREVDPGHIITVEGCLNGTVGDKRISWGWDALPHPDLFGWSNVVYQMHHYEWDWNNLEKQKHGMDFQIKEWEAHKTQGVPAYMGEFNFMAREEAWAHGLAAMNRAGMHWTLWSYKATHGTGSDSWGLFNPTGQDAPDLQKDDLETIRAKWKAVRTEQSFALNPMLDRVLRAALADVAPPKGPVIPVSSKP